jgi:hypothetical protein
MKRMQCRLSTHARIVASCGTPLSDILVWLGGLLLNFVERIALAWLGKGV